MNEQLSVAVKFVAFFVKTKVGATGLTVTVDVWGASGTKIIDDIAATEIGGGLYSYTLSGAATGTEGIYTAIFKTADTDVDARHVAVTWAVGVAGVEALTRIGSAQVTVTSPISALGTAIELIRGDDYYHADGRSVIVTRASTAAEWPDLTGATVRLKTPAFTAITGTVVVATGAGQSVRFDVARTLTASLPPGSSYDFEIEATLATTARVVTLVRGTLKILRDI